MSEKKFMDDNEQAKKYDNDFTIKEKLGVYASDNVDGYEDLGIKIPAANIKIPEDVIKSKRITLPFQIAIITDGHPVIYTWTKDNWNKGVKVLGIHINDVKDRIDNINSSRDYSDNQKELDAMNNAK